MEVVGVVRNVVVVVVGLGVVVVVVVVEVVVLRDVVLGTAVVVGVTARVAEMSFWLASRNCCNSLRFVSSGSLRGFGVDVTIDKLLKVVVLGVELLVVGCWVVVVVGCVVVVDFCVVVVGLGVVVVEVVVVVVVVVVVTGFSATGSNVEVMELLSSETSILMVASAELAELAELSEMRSSTSSGIACCSTGGMVVGLRSTMLSGTVLSATAASSVLVLLLVKTAGVSELDDGAFHR